MDRRTFLGLLAVPALTPFTGCVSAHPRYAEVAVSERQGRLHVIFSERDRELIHEHYAPRRKPLPPGLTKQGKLPPGHARQMDRWGRLPPGVEYRHLPVELERQLSRLPDGYVRIVLGADIGILDVRARVVVDVIQDIASDD